MTTLRTRFLSIQSHSNSPSKTSMILLYIYKIDSHSSKYICNKIFFDGPLICIIASNFLRFIHEKFYKQFCMGHICISKLISASCLLCTFSPCHLEPLNGLFLLIFVKTMHFYFHIMPFIHQMPFGMCDNLKDDILAHTIIGTCLNAIPSYLLIYSFVILLRQWFWSTWSLFIHGMDMFDDNVRYAVVLNNQHDIPSWLV